VNEPSLSFYYTIIQLVMGAVMAGAGLVLIAGVFWINYIPTQAMLALLALALAGKYLMDGIIQMMSAMGTNVEEDIPVPENIREMI
jgi:hypothetical protein